MQTPAQRCARLVSALEDLAAQEEASLHARDFSAIVSIQERTGAIVTDLVAHAAATDRELRARVAAVQQRRDRCAEWLANEIAGTRDELRETEVSRNRVAKIAPVYGSSGSATPSRLSVVG
jgi:hypothetical protein